MKLKNNVLVKNRFLHVTSSLVFWYVNGKLRAIRSVKHKTLVWFNIPRINLPRYKEIAVVITSEGEGEFLYRENIRYFVGEFCV